MTSFGVFVGGRARIAAGSLVLLAASACAEHVSAPELQAPVQVTAALTGSAVEWLSIEATGSDVAVPVVATLAATGATATGTITVPPGPARTFTARGYDVEGTLTHRASATVDVAPGTGATLSLVLVPVTDEAPGAGGDDRVTLATTELSLAVGATRRLSATVMHADGSAAPDARVTWATLDPAVATVSRTGLVSAIARGTTQVVALSGGGAAMATVVVQ